jgi:hypothetical protein
MLSFQQLWEQMHKSPLMTSGDDSRVLTAVRVGKDMHQDGETSFWDEFITLCANTDGLSELLDVSPQKISSWPARIRENLEKLQRHDAESPHHREEEKLMPTGENGAVTTNVDPYLGELT